MAEELVGGAAFPYCPLPPIAWRRDQRPPRIVQEPRNRTQAGRGRLQSLRQGREVARDQRDHREDRFTGPERGVAAIEAGAFVLGDLDVQEAVCQREVHLLREHLHLCVRYTPRAIEHATQLAHVRDRPVQPFWRPVRKPIVIGMDAGERRRHRPLPVVELEEPIERGPRRHASGSATHRRSRYDASTALIVSCTHAPSSKFPSLPEASPRISLMKLLTRLA